MLSQLAKPYFLNVFSLGPAARTSPFEDRPFFGSPLAPLPRGGFKILANLTVAPLPTYTQKMEVNEKKLFQQPFPISPPFFFAGSVSSAPSALQSIDRDCRCPKDAKDDLRLVGITVDLPRLSIYFYFVVVVWI